MTFGKKKNKQNAREITDCVSRVGGTPLLELQHLSAL